MLRQSVWWLPYGAPLATSPEAIAELAESQLLYANTSLVRARHPLLGCARWPEWMTFKPDGHGCRRSIL